ncbi:MAG: type II toxin-antitoxin system VapC family toxin [Saprospiraceae bacterium]|nr:type II toxin-antitoxin system VapC family toxin [Saprospiraceae bacterium]
MTYLLDTNILFIYIKGGEIRERIEQNFDPFGRSNSPIISSVAVGEIKSIAKRNNWGVKRLLKLNSIQNDLITADINSEDVFEQYAEIHTFSQGKHKDKPLMTTSRNMGKNDLWIAATAHVSNATLLTTDRDFDHLDGVYFEVGKVQQGSYLRHAPKDEIEQRPFLWRYLLSLEIVILHD